MTARRGLLFAACTFALGSAAHGEQFWTAWEGDTYPEETGWTRLSHGGGAQRSLGDGLMTLDGRASIEIADLYRVELPFDVSPESPLIVQWRLRVDEVHGYDDPGMSIGFDGRGVVTLTYSESTMRSWYEGVQISFAPGIFHEYALTSSDLVNYALCIDGQLVHEGLFIGPWDESSVSWGDCILGSRSLSTWDFFRVGNVPEPAGALLLGWAGLLAIRTFSRPKRRSLS